MTQELTRIGEEHTQTIVAGLEEQKQLRPLDVNPAAVYLASLRPTGRRSMHHYLNRIADKASGGQYNALTFNWASLRYQHTTAIRAWMATDFGLATANTMRAALRRVLSEAYKLGQLEAEDYRKAIDFPPIKGETLLRGRALAGGELSALMSACGADQSPAGARDSAMLGVAYGAGLRRSEIVKLDLADYDPEIASLKVRGGKGGKDRLTYLATGPAAAVADWLTVRGSSTGPLFCAINKAGRVRLSEQMTDQAVFSIFRKRAKQAGVSDFSPHDIRRSTISDLLDAGADIATVQKLAGHASVVTTARYDRRGEVAKQKAAGLIHLPYQRRRLNLGA